MQEIGDYFAVVPVTSCLYRNLLKVRSSRLMSNHRLYHLNLETRLLPIVWQRHLSPDFKAVAQ